MCFVRAHVDWGPAVGLKFPLTSVWIRPAASPRMTTQRFGARCVSTVGSQGIEGPVPFQCATSW